MSSETLKKANISLVDPSFVEGMAYALMFGKEKYQDKYRDGYYYNYSENISAAYRHINDFLRGENLDKESGVCHLYHAATRLMFLAWTLKHKPEMDDRWKQ